MLKEILRSFYSKVLDGEDWIRRYRAGKLQLPPRRLRDVGGDNLEDFEVTGQEFIRHFKELCALSPDAKVLEIGCGSGRIALPLTTYISEKGAYTGVEIVAPSVRWCTKKITTQFPNFTFVHADLFNKRYNPLSSMLAKDYRFPFNDSSFDFIYLTSVFTHLLLEDAEHYLYELRRLLKPNGKILMTYFLLNKEQKRLAEKGKNQIHFMEMNSCFQVRDKEVLESAVAYDETYLLGFIDRLGFRQLRPICYGTWSGRQDGRSFQDIVIISLKNDNCSGSIQ